MTNLLDVRQDYIFKLIFADERNKDVLIALLNAILKGNPHVCDITIQNPEMPKIFSNSKWIYLDIKANIGDDQYVNIEMQTQNTVDLIDRGIQYLGRMLVANARHPQSADQSGKKRWNYAYPKVIGIWIIGDKLSEDYGSPVNEAVMTFKPNEMRSYQIVSDKIRLFTIELPKFNPKRRRHKDMLDDWMAFFNNPMDEEALKNYEIHKALEALQYLSSDEKVREQYESRNDAILYEMSLINTSRDEGEKIGEARGIEKGRAEERAKAEAEKRELAEKAEAEKKAEKIESARKALAIGLTLDQVANITGLSVEEIEKLS